MIWWVIPLTATLLAWAWTRLGTRSTGPWARVARSSGAAGRPGPAPGSPEDIRELARLADALNRPLPGGHA